LEIGSLLGTKPEIKNGRFTGKIDGPFLMKEGKLKTARKKCSSRHIKLDTVTFYADSITDVALLENVGFPVVVNPKEKFCAVAVANQ
jgi:putative phosphoserine phosphatase/1-acylglycerol-3-phosphate O-acyltransferase